MITKILRSFGLIVPAAALLFGQQGRLGGPVAGFVFDGASHSLRAIQGIPGASLVGDPVNFGMDVSAAFVSPRLDSAIVVAADNSVHYFQFTPSGLSESPLNSLNGAPQRVVFSPSGTAAALIAGGRAQIMAGLPSAPGMTGTVELSLPKNIVTKTTGAPLERRIAADPLALSDDGQYLLRVAAGSVWLLSAHGENRRLVAASIDGLVAFAPGSHNAALIDSGSLSMIQDVPGAATRNTVPAGDDAITSAVGLAFSKDNAKLYVASATAKSVTAYDLAASTHSAIACDCTPSTLIPMGDVYRLNELGSAPLWLLDPAAPRIVFVPAKSN